VRLYRLLSPGILFASVGLAVLLVSGWPWFQMRGGLATTGGLAFALQFVLSMVALSAIDDLAHSSTPAFAGGRAGRGSGGLIEISTRPISFSQAFLELHRRTFWPAFLVAFGAGATLSALVAGAFRDYSPVPVLSKFGTNRTEVILGVMLVVGAIILWGGVAAPTSDGSSASRSRRWPASSYSCPRPTSERRSQAGRPWRSASA
jgi:hypothetical protein